MAPAREAVAQAQLGQRGHFAAAVAIDGLVGAVGSPRAMAGGSPHGRVDVFRLSEAAGDGRSRRIVARGSLLGRALPAHSRLGAALALGGDWLAVGAPGAGLVRVYRVGSPVVGTLPLALEIQLEPEESFAGSSTGSAAASAAGGSFGAALAWSSNRAQLAIGAPFARAMDGTALAGAVYVFERADGVWRLAQRLEAPAPMVAATFGHAVAWVGETLVVAAPGDGTLAPGCGRLFGFHGGQLAWELPPPFAASDAHGVRYGEALAAIDGASFAVGLPGRGAVEVLDAVGGSGSSAPVHRALLRGSAITGFGRTLAASPSHLVVGEPFRYGASGEPSAGAVRLYARAPGSAWSSAGSLASRAPAQQGEFGVSAGVAALPSGATLLLVGEPGSHAACLGERCAAGLAALFTASGPARDRSPIAR